MKNRWWYFQDTPPNMDPLLTEQAITQARLMTESVKRIFQDMIGARPQFVYCDINPIDCTWQITYCLPVDVPQEFFAKGREASIEKLCKDMARALKEAYPEERIARMRLGRSALVHDIIISIRDDELK